MKEKIYDFEKVLEKGLSIEDFFKLFYKNELSKRTKMSLNDIIFNDSPLFTEMILNAQKNHLKIAVIGDYDADGMTSSAIMYKTLHYLGIDNEIIIPNRFTNGYGLSVDLVKKAIELNCNLIVTVDNGIVAYEAIDYAKSQGLMVIVTDHHSIGDHLPNADLIINPNLHKDNIKASNICGAFTAFILCRDILQAVHGSKNLIEALAELAGIGTIADVMPLEYENNKIVKYTLSNMHRCIDHNIGLRLLAQQMFTNLVDATAEDLAFTIIPALNATGRMEDATLGFKLLTTTNLSELIFIINKITILNDYRKKYSRKYSDILAKQLNENDKVNCLVLKRTHYDKDEIDVRLEGIIGIIASKIVEDTQKVTFIFCENENGDLVASGRTFGNVNISELVLSSVKNNEISVIKAGGHAGAMGLTIKKSEFSNFKKVLNSKDINYDDEASIEKVIKLPINIKIKDLREALNKFEPFGEGFRKPIFRVETTPTGLFVFSKIHSQFEFKIGGQIEKGLFYFKNNYEIKPMNVKFEIAPDYLNIKDITYLN